MLVLSDAFSSANYRLMPGQHVLFEHGNLREVVDREKSPLWLPCRGAGGCARERLRRRIPFLRRLVRGWPRRAVVNNVAPVGETHAQITSVMSNTSDVGAPTAVPPAPSPQAAATTSTEPPKTPPGAHAIGSAIKRFFHRLFHPGPSAPTESEP